MQNLKDERVISKENVWQSFYDKPISVKLFNADVRLDY